MTTSETENLSIIRGRKWKDAKNNKIASTRLEDKKPAKNQNWVDQCTYYSTSRNRNNCPAFYKNCGKKDISLRCVEQKRNNDKDEDNSPKTLNDKNHQASSQKFRQLKKKKIGKIRSCSTETSEHKEYEMNAMLNKNIDALQIDK